MRSGFCSGVYCLLLVFTPIHADDDVVEFANGDRLTGEVKGLDRGQLEFKTDATGTIQIEWNDVAGLISNQYVEVDHENGDRLFGRLGRSQASQTILITTDQGEQIVAMSQIVSIAPIETERKERIDGDVVLGYNYTKANDVTQFNLGATVEYRDERRVVSAKLNTGFTESANNDSTDRSEIELSSIRLLPDRWVRGVLANAERNEELGLDRRLSIGVGGGRYLRLSNDQRILLAGGAIVNQEKADGSGETNRALDGFLSLEAEWFRYDEPELDISSKLSVYPSISDSGRVRSDLDVRVKWEIVSDLFFDVSFYHNYDNRPPSDAAETTDYGARTSLGWDF